MIKKTYSAPDWESLEFKAGRFRVLHDLLDAFERRSLDSNTPIERAPYLKECQDDQERELMIREMNYLEQIASDPVTFVGQYLIDKPVGVGAFGVVSLAYDPEGSPVAIKVPHLSWQLAKSREELETEAKILKELSHPNIVEFIECGYDGNWFLVTEWINGRNLDQAIDEVVAPIEHWTQIILQVCDALSFGHRMGIVHRDIKPKNIMVFGQGTPEAKVLDYGIAKRINHKSSSTEHIKGTGEYVAPEQHSGHCDNRSDIYSLGVTLSRVLGHLKGHEQRKAQSLKRIVQKATRKKPSRRYQSIDEMRRDIEVVAKSGFARKPKPPLISAAVFSVLAAVVLLCGHFSSKPNQMPQASNTQPTESTDEGTTVAPDARAAVPETEQNQNIGPIGFQKVHIRTVPRGGKIAAYRLDHGEPVRDAKIALSGSWNTGLLLPGDYLLVTKWPDGQFTEVLRRVPIGNALPPPKISRFDSFVRLPDNSIQLSTITSPSFSNANTLSVGSLQIDKKQRAPLRIHPAISTFSLICCELEKEGKRLPFYSELQAIKNAGALEFPKPEWTSTIAFRTTINFQDQLGHINSAALCKLRVFTPTPKPLRKYCPENDRSAELLFRGVRADQPFDQD